MTQLEQAASRTREEYQVALADAEAGIPGAEQLAAQLSKQLKRDEADLQQARNTEAGKRINQERKAKAEKIARERAEDKATLEATMDFFKAIISLEKEIASYAAHYAIAHSAETQLRKLLLANPRVKSWRWHGALIEHCAREITRVAWPDTNTTINVPVKVMPAGGLPAAMNMENVNAWPPISKIIEQFASAVERDLKEAESKREGE